MEVVIKVVTAVIPVITLPYHETTNFSRETSFHEESSVKETSQYTCKLLHCRPHFKQYCIVF